jgi:hypothetical protein
VQFYPPFPKGGKQIVIIIIIIIIIKTALLGTTPKLLQCEA